MLAECALLTLALSHHINPKNEFNEVHPSIGVVCEESPIGEVSLGYYYNSDRDHTLWIAKRERLDYSQKMFYEYGTVLGYAAFPVLPMVRVGYDLGFAEVFFAPTVEMYKNENSVLPVIGIQFKYSF